MGLRHLLVDDAEPRPEGVAHIDGGPAHDELDDDQLDDDEPLARFVRPFALTGGRTRNERVEVDVAAVVCQAPSTMAEPPALGAVEGEIWRLAAERISVAEMSVRLDLALGVVRVLVGDLVDATAVALGETRQTGDAELLRRLIDGVRTI